MKPIDERFKVLLDRLGLGTIHPTPSAGVELPLSYKLSALTLTPRCAPLTPVQFPALASASPTNSPNDIPTDTPTVSPTSAPSGSPTT